jgi:Xaa-Pro aminopeptidase
MSREAHRARLAPLFDDADLAAVLLSSYQAVSYFGGTQLMTQVAVPDRLAFALVFRDRPAVLLVSDLEASTARSQTDVAEVREYVEFADDPARAAAALLREHGCDEGRIGIEARRLPAVAYQVLRSELPEVELIAVDDRVERAQAAKQESEVEGLAFAAGLTVTALCEAAAGVGAGDSELAFVADVAQRLTARGGVINFMVFGAAERGRLTHGEAADRPLKAGDIWRADVGARFFETLNSDVARTGVVGEPTEHQESILAALRATQEAGFAAVEPGRPASQVYEAVKREFDRQDLRFAMPHVGHGLGIALHEFPMLEPRNDAPLEVGMVLNIEPLTAVENACYHIEDLVVVVPGGYKLLTQPQDALIRMTA